jgi:sodium-dependent dicarboxylate transporter 2/3/5
MTSVVASQVQQAREAETSEYGLTQIIGLILGPALFALMLLIPLPAGMSLEAAKVAAITFWVAVWWITEPIPIPASSLLPLILLPATGATSVGDASGGYADPLIFVFIGGFMLAIAMEYWQLHRRLGMQIIARVGTSPTRIVLGFIAATGLLSMWMSNTATAMMMMPMGLAVVKQMADLLRKDGQKIEAAQERDLANLSTAVVLGVAYAASIGGIGTLIGTPPNIVFAKTVKELLGTEVSFAGWMILGVPLALLGLGLTWFFIVKVAVPVSNKPIPGALDVIKHDLAELGPMSRAERSVLIVFGLVAFAWITRQWLIKPILPNVDDAVIAIAGAVALFLIPVNLKKQKFVLDWKIARGIPWGIVLLFGGGIAIADAFEATGLSEWLGGALGGLSGVPSLLAILLVVTTVVFLSEFTSNTATATLFMPLMIALGIALNLNPLLLMVATALGASWAFMLPAGTPPNAIAFGTGHVTINQMVRTGLWLNIGGILIMTAVVYWLVPLLWPGS